MPDQGGLKYAECRRSIEAMVEADQPFPAVEAAVDACSVPDDERAALWAFAWSLRSLREERGWPNRSFDRPVLVALQSD